MTRIRRTLRSYVLLISLGYRACPSFMLGAILLQVVTGVTFVGYPYSYEKFVDAFLHHRAGELILAAIFGGLCFVVTMITTMIGVNAGMTVMQRSNIYLVARIAELVNQIPGIDHLERPEYLRKFDLLNQNRNVLAGAPQQALMVLSQAIRVVLMVVLLTKVNAIFLLVPVVGLLPFFGDSYASRYRQSIDSRNVEDVRLANQLFALSATAAPAKEIRVFGLADELDKRHDQIARLVSSRVAKASAVAVLAGGLGWLAFAVAFVGAIALVVVQAAHGHTSPGQVLLSVILVMNLQFRVGRLLGGSGQLLQARKTALRYMWLEDHARQSVPPPSLSNVPAGLSDGIVFDHVSFSYPGSDRPVLNDICLHLPARTSIAIVGENGAGKTTLIKLLSRMYEPSAGAIRVDGKDLQSFDINEWRSRVVAIFQDFGRYELSARQTVGVGDLQNIDENEVVSEALRKTGGLALIDELDEGLDTLLGRSFNGGRELSGGQWQKLALARGRMRDDSLLLILDEPTASLDAPTEHEVFEQFVAAARDSALSIGAITILISHRFSTVRMADLIVVLDDGTIREVGSHVELLAADGLYAELFNLQQRSYR